MAANASQPCFWITGAGGFLGHYLVQTARQFAPGWRVRELHRTELTPAAFPALSREFASDPPQLVIHCAAISSVAEAKASPDLARAVNVTLTRELATLAAAIPFVFFSTDLIYNGKQGMYQETDPPNPLHLYGETKAEAEQLVLANPRHLVLRTSINGGNSATGNRSFNEQLRLALQKGQGMTLFTDEFRSPIPALVTVRVLWELVRQGRTGLYNVAGAERLSRWQIGRLLLPRWPELADRADAILPGSARDFPGPPRALDTSLDIVKVQAVLAEPIPGLSAWLAAHPHEPF